MGCAIDPGPAFPLSGLCMNRPPRYRLTDAEKDALLDEQAASLTVRAPITAPASFSAKLEPERLIATGATVIVTC